MNLKDKIAVMQAFERGEDVQMLWTDGVWRKNPDPHWDWANRQYRITPKTRYLPVFEVPRPVAWYSTKEAATVLKPLGGLIGYLEDKQDGSPYILHQL